MSEYILCRCKSEQAPPPGKRQIRHYRVSIKYSKNGILDINAIIKTSECTCRTRGFCKHIIATLLHARDLDNKILQLVEQKDGLSTNQQKPLIQKINP